MFKKIIIFFISILSVTLIYAGPGTEEMIFLKFSSSVRASALADSTVSFPFDVNNMFYNPAGGMLSSVNFGGSYTMWLQSTGFLHFAGRLKLGGFGNLGIGVISLVCNDMFKVTENNGVLEQTEESIKASDYSFLLNYSKNLGQRFFFGINAKFISESMDTSSLNSIGGDAGIIYLLSDSLSSGISVLNLGVPNAPMLIKAGLSLNKDFNKKSGMILSLEGDKNGDIGYEAGFGLELKFINFVKLRIGYKLSQSIENFRAGVGISLKNIDVDYGFAYTSLGLVNRFGLRMAL